MRADGGLVAANATPRWAVGGLTAAVFACVVAILLYAAWDGKRNLGPDAIQREADIRAGAGSN